MADYRLTQTGEQIQSDLNKVESLAPIKSIGSGLSLNSAGQLSATGGSGAVSSVNGKTGAVVLTAEDIEGGLVIPDGETRETNELVSINSDDEQEQIAIGSGLSVTTGTSGKKTLSVSNELYQHVIGLIVTLDDNQYFASIRIYFISKNSEVLNTKQKLVDELTRCSYLGKPLIYGGFASKVIEGTTNKEYEILSGVSITEQSGNVFLNFDTNGTQRSKNISDEAVYLHNDYIYQIK